MREHGWRIPETERIKFQQIIGARAGQYGMAPEEYLRKIWYHQQAARLGEYVAGMLKNWLIGMAASGNRAEE